MKLGENGTVLPTIVSKPLPHPQMAFNDISLGVFSVSGVMGGKNINPYGSLLSGDTSLLRACLLSPVAPSLLQACLFFACCSKLAASMLSPDIGPKLGPGRNWAWAQAPPSPPQRTTKANVFGLWAPCPAKDGHARNKLGPTGEK